MANERCRILSQVRIAPPLYDAMPSRKPGPGVTPVRMGCAARWLQNVTVPEALPRYKCDNCVPKSSGEADFGWYNIPAFGRWPPILELSASWFVCGLRLIQFVVFWAGSFAPSQKKGVQVWFPTMGVAVKGGNICRRLALWGIWRAIMLRLSGTKRWQKNVQSSPVRSPRSLKKTKGKKKKRHSTHCRTVAKSSAPWISRYFLPSSAVVSRAGSRLCATSPAFKDPEKL